MKRMLTMATIGTVAVFMSGCEWDGGGGDNGWSTTGIGSDISGTYKASDGSYLVRKSAPAGPAGVNNAGESLGTGNGANATFSKTLDNKPVTRGSVQISDGVEAFTDPEGDGTLTGTIGGNGTVNYTSGQINVNFNTAPGIGVSVLVSYSYPVSGTAENPASGSSKDILYFNVQQMGNKVRLQDNNGDTYEGALGVTETSTSVSGSSTNTVATMYQFSVSGKSGGNSATLTGVFNVSASTMHATWVEEGGKTGSVDAQRM